MKKLIASALVLSMLSSTGVMCFASPGEGQRESQIICESQTDEQSETAQNQESTKVEIINELESIKKESSLTWKEKVAKAWNYLKDFVKRHYVIVGTITVATVATILACCFGPEIVGRIKGFFNRNEQGSPKISAFFEFEEGSPWQIEYDKVFCNGSDKDLKSNQENAQDLAEVTRFIETVKNTPFEFVGLSFNVDEATGAQLQVDLARSLKANGIFPKNAHYKECKESIRQSLNAYYSASFITLAKQNQCISLAQIHPDLIYQYIVWMPSGQGYGTYLRGSDIIRIKNLGQPNTYSDIAVKF